MGTAPMNLQGCSVRASTGDIWGVSRWLVRVGTWVLLAAAWVGVSSSQGLAAPGAGSKGAELDDNRPGGGDQSSEDQLVEVRNQLIESSERNDSTNRFLGKLAEHHERSEQYRAAALVYAHLAGLYPEEPHYGFKTAQMHAYAGDDEEAILLLRTLRDRNPDDYDSSVLLARVYGWSGRWSQAEQVILDLEKAYPNDPEIDKLRGDLLYYQGRFPEARRQYEKVLERRTQDPDAMRSLAKTYLALGEVDRAKTLRPALAEAGETETVRQIDAVDKTIDKPFRLDIAPMYAINVDRDDWVGGRATLMYAINERVALGGGLDVQSRLDLDSTNVMLLLLGAFRPADRFGLEVELGFTPSADFRPTFSGRLTGTIGVVDWLDLMFYYRVMNFRDGAAGDDLWVNQVGPGIGLHFGPVSLGVSYRLTIFDQDELDIGHLGVLDLRIQLPKRWALLGSAAYGDGTEVFYDPNPVIQNALTLMGGVEYSFKDGHGIRGLYSFFTTDPEREDPDGLYQHGITLHYFVHF